MDPLLQLNEFFVEGGNQELSHVLLHITEPSTPEETEKGYFFALCEMNYADPAYIGKLQEIIDAAENQYYETPDEPDKSSLEVILEKINQQAYKLTNNQVTLHCVIGVIRQPEIIFTYSGQPHMFLFYKNRQGLFQRLNLITNDRDDATTPAQLFSDIIQGKISPRDFLFVGTPHLTEYFSPDRLQKIITTRPARQSAEHIERVLGELKEGYSFGGLIIHIHHPSTTEAVVKKQRPLLRKPSSGSLNSLFATERQTAHTLSPSILPKMSEAIKSIFKDRNPAPARTTPGAHPPPPAEINAAHKSAPRPRPTLTPNNNSEKLSLVLDWIWSALRFLGRVVAWCAVALYSIAYWLISTILLCGVVIINYQNRRKNILDAWTRQWRSYKENLRQLPLITKILLISSAALIIIFGISIFYVRQRQQTLALEQTFQNTLQEFKQHKNAMDSSLIYKDEAGAIRELAAARDLLARTDCTNKYIKEDCATIISELEALAIKIRKVTVVAPQLVATWSDVGAAPQGLARAGSILLAYSEATSTVLTYDTANNVTAFVKTNSDITGFSEAAVPKENDYVALVYDQDKLLNFHPTDHTNTPFTISYPADNITLTGITIYNRRLYALDTTSAAIYRHDAIKTGFEQGRRWNENGQESLGLGSDLTIDGDIYILLNSGRIMKFSKGALQPFDISGLDPALVNGGKLWTYADSLNLYILDNTGKRLIILDKSGRLIQQITAPEFVKPDGLVIDEPNKIAYILDSGKLYKFNLPL